MKKFVLGAAATLCLALTSGSTLAQPGPGPDHRVEHNDHRVDHRHHHRHQVCHMRHHHKVCHWE